MIDLCMLALAPAAGQETTSLMTRIMQWFDVTGAWQFWWLALGLAGQAIFTGRWIIQWIASERRRESHVPELFWWCSIVGAAILLAYFVGKRDLVGILGQLFGFIVYGRNLYLVKKKLRSVEEGPGGQFEPR